MTDDRLKLKYCPNCKQHAMFGNYCSECGTRLKVLKPEHLDCPCCGGTGKITKYSEAWCRWEMTEKKILTN